MNYAANQRQSISSDVVNSVGKAPFRQRVGVFDSNGYAYVSAELKRNPLPSRGDGMAEVINLRTVRRRENRQRHNQSAHANRLAFGQPKQVRKIEAARQAKAGRDLDRHRVEIGDQR